jgi:hypothetical protein
MKSLGLNIKLGERRSEKMHSFDLTQSLNDGYSSIYCIKFNPTPISGKYHIEILYGLCDQYKNLIMHKCGSNIYKFTDPKKAIGFLLKKKKEKLIKGYMLTV